jgi:hypothetical protein
MLNNGDVQAEVMGRQFIFRPFTPQKSFFWAVKILGSAAPSAVTGLNLVSAFSDFSKLDETTINALYKDALRSVFEPLSGVLKPIVDDKGNSLIEGLDGLLSSLLVVQSVGHTFKNFFGPQALEAVTKMFQSFSPPTPTGQEPSSIPQS